MDNCGIIFTKTKQEIDELLFAQQLYKDTKKYYRNVLKERLSKQLLQKEKATTSEAINAADNRIAKTSLYLDTVGICMFYFIAMYYELKAQFEVDPSKTYNYEKYYSDKTYRNQMIEKAANLFLTNTVQILVKTATDNGKAGNVNNWIRSANCEPVFLNELRESLNVELNLEKNYIDFCNEYKCI